MKTVEMQITDSGIEPLTPATAGSAAYDLQAAIASPVTLRPQKKVQISTGIRLNMKESPGLCALVLPRSGLGSRGLILANTIGLIDNDYQGIIYLQMYNSTKNDTFVIEPLTRIAQLLFIHYTVPKLIHVYKFLRATARGTGGFGSTGE